MLPCAANQSAAARRVSAGVVVGRLWRAVIRSGDGPTARTNFVPPLTTIRQDIHAGARGLVDLLLRRLAGEETESLILPPKMIVRETA